MDSDRGDARLARDGPLLVIGVGLVRTGTSSLKFALETLYENKATCYHMREIMKKHSNHLAEWRAIAEDSIENKKRNSKATICDDRMVNLFKGYRFSTDVPACFFYRKLMQIYPNAKVKTLFIPFTGFSCSLFIQKEIP
ncbi:hypothetical protein Ciccas_001295 [Cichlidogyrus casuarinus]|uniref:Sulfotransferase n=1 Tax=Cichlidogyrus casuarinus TaxID=1844966 RepID=A0ABD2QNH5_9PLAT